MSAPVPVTSPGMSSLREQVLRGDAGGWRLGLGVLHNRGIAGWLAAWDDLPAPDPGRPARPARRPAAANSWSRRWPQWRCPAWPLAGEQR